MNDLPQPSIRPCPKQKPFRNPAYLKFIRQHVCIETGGPAEPHHIRRSYWGAGGSQRPHDYVTIPVSRESHSPDIENRIDYECLIIRYLVEYIKKKYDKRDLIQTLMEFIEGERMK